MKFKKHMLIISISFLIITTLQEVKAQTSEFEEQKPLGIASENFEYPFPVEFLNFKTDGKKARLAYMDVEPKSEANDKTVVLMHGKNFFGEYWEDTVKDLIQNGFRVIVPDQIGFGKSSKPYIHYSFHKMGKHTWRSQESNATSSPKGDIALCRNRNELPLMNVNISLIN